MMTTEHRCRWRVMSFDQTERDGRPYYWRFSRCIEPECHTIGGAQYSEALYDPWPPHPGVGEDQTPPRMSQERLPL